MSVCSQERKTQPGDSERLHFLQVGHLHGGELQESESWELYWMDLRDNAKSGSGSHGGGRHLLWRTEEDGQAGWSIHHRLRQRILAMD